MGSLPRRQRVAAYAVILRERGGRVEILLSRLAPRVSRSELWTLPGGGVDHGEDPRDALIREVQEEAGLDATVGDRARVYSAHMPRSPRDGQLVDHQPFRLQRVAAYAVITRCAGGDNEVLLTRLSSTAAHPGRWTLPGGGVDHGEHPSVALAREVEEECGLPCEVGALLGVHDTHFSGTAPSGRIEDYHGVHLVYRARVADGEPRVVEVDVTTDAVAWVPTARIASGEVDVLDVVTYALGAERD